MIGAQDRWRALLAFGLGLLALASVWKTAPAHVGAALALLGALAGLATGPRPRWDSVDTVASLLACWLVARYALQLAGVGEPMLIDTRGGFLDWLWPLLFAPLAVDRRNPLQRVQTLWLLAMAGFAAGVGGYFLSAGVGPLLAGERLGFHLRRPLGVGLYAGAFLLSLAFTAPLWWRVEGGWRWPARVGAIAVILLCAVVLVGAQNRSTWLGLAAVGVAAAGVVLVRALRQRGDRRRRYALLLAATALLAGTVAILKGPIESRTEVERQAVDTVLAQGLDTAAPTSITIRLRIWSYALGRVPDAPLFGHGFGRVQDVLGRDLRGGAALLEGERQDHLHSTYLQTLYGQGLIGCVLWATLGLLLVRNLIRRARRDARLRPLVPAILAVLGFTAVWALTDYRLSHPDMRFFTILLLLALRLLGSGDPRDGQSSST
jgi:O-antigen ligase